MSFEITLLDLELTARIIISVLLGALIGFERELTKKPAGFRTHIFIAMGSCLFTIAAFNLLPTSTFTLDPTRVIATIVTGTAFIGAGSIIAMRGTIKGITTAASLWVTGSIGLIIGLGNYIFPIIATIITFIVLRTGVFVDKRYETLK